MKRVASIFSFFILLNVFPCGSVPVYAVTDGIYNLTETTPDSVWNGTSANRLLSNSTDYASTYGDESVVSYTLPWQFTFYGQNYSKITADTNGNIWFSPNTATSAHSFTLATTGGRGPVIATWNDDHTSASYGGVFVQHKTDAPLGDRVVVEWQTETYTDESFWTPNSFKAVLFPDGKIRIDYGTIKTLVSNDSGSGIARGDGVYNDITTNIASAPTLTGRSFLYTPTLKNLTVNFTGTGGGTVTINPAGTVTNANYTAQYFASIPMTLIPAPDQYSIFNGWTLGGVNSGLGNYLLTLSTDTTITAGFDRDAAHQVNIGGANYSSIQAAYNAAATGSAIKTWAIDYTESVNCNRAVNVILQGGYDSGYANQVGTTVIHGALTISQGKVIVNGVAIR